MATDQSRIRRWHWPEGNRTQHECPGRDCACSGQPGRLDTTNCSSKTGRCFDAIKCNHATPMQSIAAVMQERGERYRDRIAGVSERVVSHIEAMCPDEILTRSSQFEKIDTIARRTFGLNDAHPGQGCLSLNILTHHSLVQVKASLRTIPSPAE
jgi:hypothetical protein